MLRPEWKITRNHWQPDDRTLFQSHYFKENKYREQVNAPVRRCTSKAGSFQQLPASGVLQTLSGQCRDTVDFGFRPHTWAPAPHAPSEPVSPQHREGERPGLGQGRWWMRSLHRQRAWAALPGERKPWLPRKRNPAPALALLKGGSLSAAGTILGTSGWTASPISTHQTPTQLWQRQGSADTAPISRRLGVPGLMPTFPGPPAHQPCALGEVTKPPWASVFPSVQRE